MNRRSFLKAVSAVGIVAVTPLKYVAPQLHARAVRALSFMEIVSEVLYKRSADIATNVTRDNALLKRLQEHRYG